MSNLTYPCEGRTEFDFWFELVKQGAKENFGYRHSVDFQPEDWRLYYEDGFSPLQAIGEDELNA